MYRNLPLLEPCLLNSNTLHLHSTDLTWNHEYCSWTYEPILMSLINEFGKLTSSLMLGVKSSNFWNEKNIEINLFLSLFPVKKKKISLLSGTKKVFNYLSLKNIYTMKFICILCMLIVIDKLTAYWSLLTAATAAPLLKFFSAKKLQKFIDKQILFPNGNNEKKNKYSI